MGVHVSWSQRPLVMIDSGGGPNDAEYRLNMSVIPACQLSPFPHQSSPVE